MKRLVLLLAVPTLTACWYFNGPETSTSSEPPHACTSSSLLLNPATPVDYVELRVGTTRIAATYDNEPCFTYDSRESCLSSLEAVNRPGGALVTTSGSQIDVIDDPDAVVAFLGTIDRADEALLLATMFFGESAFDCDANVQVTDDGFDVWAWSASCNRADQKPMTRFHVTHAGVVTATGTVACPVGFTFPGL